MLKLASGSKKKGKEKVKVKGSQEVMERQSH